jgi:hypothetical protein
MSIVSNIANYGGRQPSNTQNIKQFFVSENYNVWINKKLPSGLFVITPINKKMPVYIDNNLYVTGSIYNTSDFILKENITSLSPDTNNLFDSLIPVEYNFTADIKKKKHYGFIAQEVETLFPNLVNDNNLGYKSINYIELIPILINKIHTIQNEIKKLKDKFEDK